MDNVENIKWNFRRAVQKLHRVYCKNPWIFINEDDIKCSLYSELLKTSSAVRNTLVEDLYENDISSDVKYKLLTRSLHAELSSSHRGDTEYVDLCLLDPAKFKFWVKKTKYNRRGKQVPIYGWQWDYNEAIGIEIKFNQEIWKEKSRSRRSNRESITRKWRVFQYNLCRDIKKLKKYKYGWLIIVDQQSLLYSPNKTSQKWRVFFSKLLENSRCKKYKYKINGYYLCPRLKRALPYVGF